MLEFIEESPDYLTRSSIRVTIPLPSIPASGTFRFAADAAADDQANPCHIVRTLNLHVDSGQAVISQSVVPIPQRYAARVRIVEQRQDSVVMEARTNCESRCEFSWATTSGLLEVHRDRRATWRLPDEPGIHQVQLIADFGEHGLAFDTLAVEVRDAPA